MPTLACPATQEPDFDGNCMYDLLDYALLATISDNCDMDPTVVQSPAAGTSIMGQTDVTLTVTDASGNSTACTFSVDPKDRTVPDLTCPGNQELTADASCMAQLSDYTGLVIATDNCDPAPTVTQSPAAGTAFSSSTTVTIMATDASGNSTSCTFDVAFIDDIAPAITCPGTITRDLDENCEYALEDLTALLTTSDNCDSNPAVVQSPVAGTVLTEETSVIFTITDASGNSTSCTTTVQVEDNTMPTLACPGLQEPDFDGACSYDLLDYTLMATFADNCDMNPAVVQSPAAGTSIGSATVVTITVTDADGNSNDCTFTVDPQDVTAPSITCPADQEPLLLPDCTFSIPDYAAMATAMDNCDMMLSITQTPTEGTSITSATTVTLVATDDAGNSTSCTFNVDPKEFEAPTLVCPGTQMVDFDANCEYALLDYSGITTLSDNCDPNPSLVQVPAPGTAITETTSVTLTATDAMGNSTSCSFSVVPSDVTMPAITCPDTQLQSLNENCEASLLDYTILAVVSDNCDASPAITQSPVLGTTINSNTTVTLTATDASGNSSSCTFTVEPVDVVAPTITCAGGIISPVDENCAFTLLDYTLFTTLSDACDPNPTVVQSPPVGTVITADMTVLLTASDASGNTRVCETLLFLRDEMAPSTTCPVDQEPAFSADCDFDLIDYSTLATIVDNCDPSPAIVQTPAVGATITEATTVTLMATDADGNSTSCSFTVDPQDVTSPSITCPADQTPTLFVDCTYDLLDYTGMATVEDNCSENLVVVQVPLVGMTITESTLITLVAVDDAGNTAACTFNVNPNGKCATYLGLSYGAGGKF